MLIVFCAEIEEAQNIKCPEAKIIITGAGLCNVIQTPRIIVNPGDTLINIGYAGSNLFPIGTVKAVNRCRRLTPSSTIEERELILKTKFGAIVGCYTADDFTEQSTKDIPLVDMELYYLASIYPQMESIKIVSDNLNYKDYKTQDLSTCWDYINNTLNNLCKK